MVLVYISYFVRHKLWHEICNIISKYSYAIFLVHHQIIAKMMATFDLQNITHIQSYVLFFAICIVIVFFCGITVQSTLLYNEIFEALLSK